MRIFCVCWLCCTIVCIIPMSDQSSHSILSAQSVGYAISEADPLSRAADILEAMYAAAVTYEGPEWIWWSDLKVRFADTNARGALYPREQTLIIPPEIYSKRIPTIDQELLGIVLGAYEKQNPQGPRFRVVKSNLGFHIIPETVHDSKGELTKANNPLDVRVSIPKANRLASEHFGTLAAVISVLVGKKIVLNAWYLDQYYAFDGVMPPRIISSEEKGKYSFAWGVEGLTARDAMIDLINGSSTTLTWRLMYVPGNVAADSYWVLNVGPLTIEITRPDGKSERRTLSFDKCKKCPPLQGKSERK